jgi:hypothetical protein
VAGGWRAASLVEDCELSFRALFAGYRTKFVKEIVAPAELPATFTAYKTQQRRWTQGWAQLQKMHLTTLLFRFHCSWLRRVQFAYHMCISWQWPAWAFWLMTFPFLIYTGHWFGALGLAAALSLYVLPSALWAVVVAVLASLETKHTYDDRLTAAAFSQRFRRILPYVVINTGMLPHQFSAFAEGLFGPLHSEFERTPKAASVTTALVIAREADVAPAPATKQADTIKVRWPYVMADALFVAHQLGWAILFAASGLAVCAIGAVYVAACVVHVGYYGDHLGRVCLVIGKNRPALPARHQQSMAAARARAAFGVASGPSTRRGR